VQDRDGARRQHLDHSDHIPFGDRLKQSLHRSFGRAGTIVGVRGNKSDDERRDE